MDEEEYVLGEDVTHLAQSPNAGESVVLSVRVDLTLLAEIERIANAEDRSLSFVIRRALRNQLLPAVKDDEQGNATLSADEAIKFTEFLNGLSSGKVTLNGQTCVTACSGGGYNFYYPPVTG